MHKHVVFKLWLFRQFWNSLTFQYFIFTILIILYRHRVEDFLHISICYSFKNQKYFVCTDDNKTLAYQISLQKNYAR